MYKLFVFDTETCHGNPHTIQLYDGETLSYSYVTKKNILDKFLEYVKPRLRSKGVNIIFVHNISYDLIILLSKYYDRFLEDSFDITYKGANFQVTQRRGRFYCVMRYKDSTLRFIDSFYFYPYSLDFLSQKLNLFHKKLPHPRYLGIKPLKTKEFVEYACNDVKVQWDLAEDIIKKHTEFDIPMAISNAQFSQYVFQRKFLKDIIPLPPNKVMTYSLLSYHGGKNAYYYPAPAEFKRLYELDIISAYPHALSLLPNFYSGDYYFTDKFNPDYLGVYYIKGIIRDTKYKVIPDSEFKYKSGEVKTWITGFELEKALRDKLIKIQQINGYIYIPNKADKRPSPFREFVNYFFHLKETTKKDHPNYIFYKLILNSLYGKFIQKSDELDNIVVIDDKGKSVNMPKVVSVGGLFNPFIATQITGYVRSRLYDLELKHKSIHTSTDSIKTFIRPQEKPGLGGLHIEIFGRCVIFRPKLYLHYDQEGNLRKYALHGFQGRAEDLEKLWQRKDTTYIRKNRIIPVRESLRRRLERPLTVESKEMNLDIKYDN